MTSGHPAQRAPFAVNAIHRDDGAILIESQIALPEIEGDIPARLAHWARETPSAPFLSEGDRLLTYGEAEQIRQRLSEALLELEFPDGRPLLILAENSIPHALAMLAATAIGVPVAVVSPAYAGPAAAPWGKLARVLDQVEPAMILADDPAAVERAIAGRGCAAPVRSVHEFEKAPVQGGGGGRRRQAEARVGLDTVAKLLFTSGSTSLPKAVINTQRMMVSNMLALAQVWPFLAERPPVMVDWLPWNHTFGGNCCFNIALWFGGHFHIDKGRPTRALIERSVAAIRQHRPTLHFNVPVGFELLLPILEADRPFAEMFFGGLDFILNGGAAMPTSIRNRIEAAALASIGRAPRIVGGWGSTETAPFATALCFPTAHAANLGVPIPGSKLKLVPHADRYELRVKGPNVTPGYWRDPALTAAAFDDEGFFRMGDAGKFADPEDAAAGVVFDGRVAENFKLSSGTFVNVGALRLAVISVGETLISDVVIAGEGRSELGLLVFANEDACRAFLGEGVCAALGEDSAANHPQVIERLRALLQAHNAGASGSSTRIARFMVAREAPSAAHDEITDKGYINQRRVLSRRAADVEALYDSGITL